MHLTQYADYSLRVLILLASCGDKLTIAEIAQTFGISHEHLRKVVHHLAGRGYISTTRGPGGGLRLAQPAKSINVGTVLRQVEPDFDVVECFDPAQNRCSLLPTCALKSALHEATNSFLTTLDKYSLADLMVPVEQVRQAKPLRRRGS